MLTILVKTIANTNTNTFVTILFSFYCLLHSATSIFSAVIN